MSVANAFGWFLWKRHWAELCAIVACMLLIRLSVEKVMDRSAPWDLWLLALWVLSLILAVLSVTLIGRLANGDSRTSLTNSGSGYPGFMMTLPVSDGWLVLAPMVFGFGVIFVLFVLFYILLSVPQRYPARDLQEPLIFAWAFTICLQAVSWSKVGKAALKITIAACLVGLGFVLFVVCMIFRRQIGLEIIPLAYACLAAVALVLAVPGFGRARHGIDRAEQLQLPWVRLPLVRRESERPRELSVWRRQGVVLPAITVCTCALYLLACRYMSPNIAIQPNVSMDMKALLHPRGLIAIIFVVALLIGAIPRKSDVFRSDLTIQPFVSTRPQSGALFVSAIFKSAVLSAILTGLLLAASTFPFLVSFAPLNSRTLGGGTFMTKLPVLFFLTAALILGVWNVQTVLLPGELSGRRLAQWAGVLAVFVLVAFTFSALQGHVIFQLEILVLNIVVAAKLVTALVSASALVRKRLMPVWKVGTIFAGWAAFVAILLFCYLQMFPSSDWQQSIPGYPTVWVVPGITAPPSQYISNWMQVNMQFIVGLAVAITPLARLFLAPLAYEWNRHR